MKARKNLVLFLISCLVLGVVLCLGVCAEDGAADAATGLSVGEIVSLAIGGVALLLLVVLCIVKRQKVAESFRAYKSEMHKITWCSWKQVYRSTAVVIVIVVLGAALIGALDYAFFNGLEYLTRIGG